MLKSSILQEDRLKDITKATQYIIVTLLLLTIPFTFKEGMRYTTWISAIAIAPLAVSRIRTLIVLGKRHPKEITDDITLVLNLTSLFITIGFVAYIIIAIIQ